MDEEQAKKFTIHGIDFGFSERVKRYCDCGCWPCGHAPARYVLTCGRCGWETSYFTDGSRDSVVADRERIERSVPFHAKYCAENEAAPCDAEQKRLDEIGAASFNNHHGARATL